MDFKVTGMDGGELMGHIRSLKTDARIIVVSAFVDLLGLSAQSTGADVIIPIMAVNTTYPGTDRTVFVEA